MNIMKTQNIGGNNMSEIGVLQVKERVINAGSNKALRREGYVPANIYGKASAAEGVTVKKDELRKAIVKYGRNAIFKIVGSANNDQEMVMIKEIQYTPIISEFLHVDFQKVSLTEEIKTEVPVKITGKELLEAKRYAFSWQIDVVLVKGLPQDIPDEIELDVSKMQPGDVITVNDLKLPNGVTTDLELDQVVASVNEGRVQKEETTEEETTEE